MKQKAAQVAKEQAKREVTNTAEKAKREAEEAKKAEKAEIKAKQKAEQLAKEKSKREAKEAKDKAKREAKEAKKAEKAEMKKEGEVEEGAKGEVEEKVGAELYKGMVKLTIASPVDYEQIRKLKEYLLQVQNLRLVIVGGSVEEGTKIVVYAEKQIPLASVIREMPSVEQVVRVGNEIQITLKAVL